VTVYAAHAGLVVAEPLGLENIGYLIFVHPYLETMP
jgi:hypothetical protein